MAQEWIEQLASDIKQKNKDAAEEFGRSQHYLNVVAEKGKLFFGSTLQFLNQNIDALRSQLQGDLTAAETTLQNVRACEVKLTRTRFPWVDATLEQHAEKITLEYGKSSGTAGDQSQQRNQCIYTFCVAPDDSLYVEEAPAAGMAEYRQPELLARRITELLFTP